MAALASAAIQDNQPAGALSQKSIDRIIREVHHELVMLPYYGVFDNLAYKVDPDGTVTLLGQVRASHAKVRRRKRGQAH